MSDIEEFEFSESLSLVGACLLHTQRFEIALAAWLHLEKSHARGETRFVSVDEMGSYHGKTLEQLNNEFKHFQLPEYDPTFVEVFTERRNAFVHRLLLDPHMVPDDFEKRTYLQSLLRYFSESAELILDRFVDRCTVLGHPTEVKPLNDKERITFSTVLAAAISRRRKERRKRENKPS